MKRSFTFLAATIALMAFSPLHVWGQSTSDGIQEDIDSCGPGNCEILLDCDTTYDLTGDPGTKHYQVIFDEVEDVWIRGCGADSTLIQYSGDSQGEWQTLFELRDDVERIQFSDLKILFDETCSSDCAPVTSSSIVSIRGGTDFAFERVWLEVNQTAQSVTDGYSIGGVKTRGGFGGTRGLRLENSHIVAASGGGLSLHECDHCVIEGTLFEWNRPTTGAASSFVSKWDGKGARLINNTFDMATSSVDPYAVGVKLQNSAPTTNEYAQIVGNSFINFPLDSDSRGVEFYGYNHAIVSSNLFEANSRCSGDITKACEDDADCDGGQTCDDAEATGIRFVNRPQDGANSGNIITGNSFDGWTDQHPGCPIHMVDDSNGNENNIIANNLWGTGSTTSDSGVCASSGQKGANDIHDNVSY